MIEAVPTRRRQRSQFRRPPGQTPTHGKSMLTRVLGTVPLGSIDGRSKVGAALRRIRSELIGQLGGPSEVSPAMLALIDQAAIKLVIATAVGEWILKQETPIENGKLVDVVMQHDSLQKTLAVLLEKIGLERRPSPVEDIRTIAAREAARTADQHESPTHADHPAPRSE